MAQSPLGEQFHNAVSLMRLRLSAISGDVESALASARGSKAIDEGQAAFMRECLRTDELLEAGRITPESVTYEQINQILRCTSLIG